MEAYKCDVCGKLYERYSKYDKKYILNITIADNTNDYYGEHRQVDLCSECYDNIVNMIVKKGK